MADISAKGTMLKVAAMCDEMAETMARKDGDHNQDSN
jgi:hypothetical protein